MIAKATIVIDKKVRNPKKIVINQPQSSCLASGACLPDDRQFGRSQLEKNILPSNQLDKPINPRPKITPMTGEWKAKIFKVKNAANAKFKSVDFIVLIYHIQETNSK